MKTYMFVLIAVLLCVISHNARAGELVQQQLATDTQTTTGSTSLSTSKLPLFNGETKVICDINVDSSYPSTIAVTFTPQWQFPGGNLGSNVSERSKTTVQQATWASTDPSNFFMEFNVPKGAEYFQLHTQVGGTAGTTNSGGGVIQIDAKGFGFK